VTDCINFSSNTTAWRNPAKEPNFTNC